MNQDLLKEIQARTLEIGKEFKRVCEKHNLRYYMSCGTLLGAVRHKGFIPWDDDMDFYMPRSDYEKLVEIDRLDSINRTNEGFDNKFIFKHWDKTQNYIWNFGKLEDTTTTAIESTIAKYNVNYKSGLGIDIFILDGGGNDENASRKHFSEITRCGGRRYDKYWQAKASPRNPFPIRQIKQMILDARRQALRFDFIMDYFKNKSKKLSHVYNFDTSKFIASPFVLCVYPNSYHKLEDFMPYIELDFEGTKFRAPNNYDAYLTRLYGDYMTPPPIEKRTGHMPYFVDLNLPFSQYKAPYIK